MRFDVHHHFDDKMAHLLQMLLVQGDKMAATIQEIKAGMVTLTAAVNDQNAELGKVRTEVQGVLTKVTTLQQTVDTLQTAINNGTVPQDVSDAFDALKTAVTAVGTGVKSVDDLIPDEITPPAIP